MKVARNRNGRRTGSSDDATRKELKVKLFQVSYPEVLQRVMQLGKN